jgi:hypothetical protein
MDDLTDISTVLLGNPQYRHIRDGLILIANRRLRRRSPTLTTSRLYMDTITLLERLLHFEPLREYAADRGPVRRFIADYSLGYTTGGTLPQPLFRYFKPGADVSAHGADNTAAPQSRDLIYNVSQVTNSLTPEELIAFYRVLPDKLDFTP